MKHDNKLIKELAQASYKNNQLDEQTVEQIAGKLNRAQLKIYIKYLKELEQQKTVIVTVPMNPTDEDVKKFQNHYPDKKIVFVKDPNLLLGLRVRDNDIITEYDLKDTLDDLVEHAIV